MNQINNDLGDIFADEVNDINTKELAKDIHDFILEHNGKIKMRGIADLAWFLHYDGDFENIKTALYDLQSDNIIERANWTDNNAWFSIELTKEEIIPEWITK